MCTAPSSGRNALVNMLWSHLWLRGNLYGTHPAGAARRRLSSVRVSGVQCVCVCVRVCVCVHLVRQHRLQAAAEVAEHVAVLVDLHPLPVVLDLGVHPVGALLHGVLDGLTRLRLQSHNNNNNNTSVLGVDTCFNLDRTLWVCVSK